MNKETYEALKRVIDSINKLYPLKNKDYRIARQLPNIKDIVQIESWIDEVSKEYEDKEL